MVIERYLAGPRPVYERAAACGRMLPEGLAYLDSWVVDDGGMARCFQLMETNDAALFDLMSRWAPDEATRNRILVQNPVTLYGLPKLA